MLRYFGRVLKPDGSLLFQNPTLLDSGSASLFAALMAQQNPQGSRIILDLVFVDDVYANRYDRVHDAARSADDVGKVYHQTNDDTYWKLTSVTPATSSALQLNAYDAYTFVAPAVGSTTGTTGTGTTGGGTTGGGTTTTPTNVTTFTLEASSPDYPYLSASGADMQYWAGNTDHATRILGPNLDASISGGNGTLGPFTLVYNDAAGTVTVTDTGNHKPTLNTVVPRQANSYMLIYSWLNSSQQLQRKGVVFTLV